MYGLTFRAMIWIERIRLATIPVHRFLSSLAPSLSLSSHIWIDERHPASQTHIWSRERVHTYFVQVSINYTKSQNSINELGTLANAYLRTHRRLDDRSMKSAHTRRWKEMRENEKKTDFTCNFIASISIRNYCFNVHKSRGSQHTTRLLPVMKLVVCIIEGARASEDYVVGVICLNICFLSRRLLYASKTEQSHEHICAHAKRHNNSYPLYVCTCT